MAMGWGIGQDVREAYSFLTENYRGDRQDEIYIFGFSRGAYAARILSALVHVVGIPELSHMAPPERSQLVERIYKAYKGDKSIADRRSELASLLDHTPQSVDIQFLGLWDTIEALGVPDYKENWVLPNHRYADQLCNIKDAAHAVSIDDDRARIFTPVLLTQEHLIRACEQAVKIDDVVDEVWFSGAHADIGGGYRDTNISGVSLNWMLKKIEPYQLVPDNTRVYEDPEGKTHNPEAGLWGLIYRKRSRSLDDYANYTRYNQNKLKIHRSVFDRLAIQKPKGYEYQWLESQAFASCFKNNGKGIEYIESKNCFTVVEK